MHPLVYERKFEIDSLAAVLYLISEYYKVTQDSTIFD
jgi:meiotically up-regulated gene 157 (Mug157) protein